MRRRITAIAVSALIVAGCGGSDDAGDALDIDESAVDCEAGDAECAEDAGTADEVELPSAVALTDPNDPDAPLLITFGGFFYSDGERSQLCSSMLESLPPQCGTVVIEIEAPLDVVLGHVADSFANPGDARVNIDQGVYWTDNWVNLSGTLQANRLVLE